MPALPAGEVHLWLAHYEAVADPRELQECHALLTEEERARMGRFYFENDRQRFLITRAMVRTTLSRYADCPPGSWRFVTNDYGRPAIAPEHGDACRLSFNISHTRGLIALAVSRDIAVGVDVENVVTRPAPLEIADRFFSADEAAALAQVDPSNRGLRFYEYWTFKESYIKARGMGLSIPLDKFGFEFPDERTVALSVDRELEDDPERWGFWQLQPSPEYLLAMCVELGSTTDPTLVIQGNFPGPDSPSDRSPALRRTSHRRGE